MAETSRRLPARVPNRLHADTSTLSDAPQPLPVHARDRWPGFLRARGWAGLNAFGGPVAPLGVMHAEVFEKRSWLSDRQFLHLLDFANIQPGPEALEVAIHLGDLRQGVPGGVIAGLLFVLPGVVSLSLLAWPYVAYGRLDDAQVIDSLALAETTPGSASSVGVFLSYLAGGFAGACVGCAYLLPPSLLFVLGLGRCIDRVARLPRAKELVFGVPAGTLGLIVALSAMLLPEMITSAFDIAVAVAAFVAIARFKLDVFAAVAAGAAVRVGRWLLLGGA